MNDEHAPGGGHVFETSVATNDRTSTRQAEIFTPADDVQLDRPPEPITTGERLPKVNDFSHLKMEKASLRGLKLFSYLALILIIGIIGWESYTIISSLAQTHWLLGLGFALLLCSVFVVGGWLLWQFLYDRNNLGSLEALQEQVHALRDSRSKDNTTELLTTLREFYADKPQGAHLLRSLEQLPDYSDVSEVIKHLSRVFLRPLDEEAARRISVHSAKIGLSIGLSPWATLDMALALWRNLLMAEDIAQLYGVRPGLANRYRLLRMIVGNMALVGGSQLLIDSSIKQLESAGALIPSMAALGQGIGAGIYSARIGATCIEVTRPIPFGPDESPSVPSLIQPLLAELRSSLTPDTQP